MTEMTPEQRARIEAMTEGCWGFDRDAITAMRDENAALTAAPRRTDEEGAADVCVCGHVADAHGNDGTGHCGATVTCRSYDKGCRQFRPAPRRTEDA